MFWNASDDGKQTNTQKNSRKPVLQDLKVPLEVSGALERQDFQGQILFGLGLGRLRLGVLHVDDGRPLVRVLRVHQELDDQLAGQRICSKKLWFISNFLFVRFIFLIGQLFPCLFFLFRPIDGSVVGVLSKQSYHLQLQSPNLIKGHFPPSMRCKDSFL